MNSSELATILNIHYKKIRRATKEAADNNLHSIKIGERFFGFELISGHYHYEEIFGEVIETNDNELSAAWRRASESQQEKALQRLKLVRHYRNRPSDENWKQFLARMEYKFREIQPTKSKLFRWLDIVVKAEERKESAVEMLLDSRGKQSNNRSYTKEQYAFLSTLFLEMPHRKATKIHQYMKEEFGQQTPSYATVMRMLERYKSENILIATLAKSPQEANNKLRPAPGDASEAARYNNAMWEMDGTPVDVMCSDGIRYQLSAAIDVYSRRVIVVVTPRANASALSRVFKKGIQKLGVPERVKLDNGKEYKSRSFEYTCARLRIEQQFTLPYSGWQKPHIERFFGTLTRDLFEELPGYIGHEVADRKELQDRETYEAKLQAKERAMEMMKHGNAAAKKLARKQKEMDAYIPTTSSREQLEAYIDQWIEKYERKRHRGIGQTPMTKWSECAVPTRTISDARVLDVLVGLSEKKRITKKGITWKGLSYWNDIFYDRVGESMWMLSDDDLGYLYIYDMEMKYLCKAEHAESIGQSRSEYLASKFFDAKTKRLIRELQEIRREMPERFKTLLDREEIEHAEEDIRLEFKSELVSNVRASLSDESSFTHEEQAELANTEEETLIINGRPVFGSIKERFDWDLRNKMVDDDTRALAEKHEGLWQMAVEEYEEELAG